MLKQLWPTFVGGGVTIVIIGLCGVETRTVDSGGIGFIGIVLTGIGIFFWRISTALK